MHRGDAEVGADVGVDERVVRLLGSGRGRAMMPISTELARTACGIASCDVMRVAAAKRAAQHDADP